MSDKKYNNMENILQNINSKFVSLNDQAKKRNNGILKEIVELIIENSKHTDKLFKALYERVFYGGSFYDGLKVGEPNEFDLDLLLKLPKQVKPTLTQCVDEPGYVQMRLLNLPALYREPSLHAKYEEIYKLHKDATLNTELVMSWMQSIFNRGLKHYYSDLHRCYIIPTSFYGKFKIKFSKRERSPAFTLEIQSAWDNDSYPGIEMDIDLVPCFLLDEEKWPEGFRRNMTHKHEFFIVPKYPLGRNDYWRLSFQEQERVLIDSKYNLKPALRLLKKLRDTQDHNISSYFLKTIVMLEIDNSCDSFWNKPLSLVFMKLLEKYRDLLISQNIPYFWNEEFNLVRYHNGDNLYNLYGRINRIINELDKYLDQPDELQKRVHKYLLTTDESNSSVFQSTSFVPYSGFPPSTSDYNDSSSDDEDYHVGTTTANPDSVLELGLGLGLLGIGAVLMGVKAWERYRKNRGNN